MTPEDTRLVVETAINNSIGLKYWQIILLVVLSGVGAFIGAYLKAKAKSTATKEDIENITRKIESVKTELAEQSRIFVKKYELKYDSCLNMFLILDAHL